MAVLNGGRGRDRAGGRGRGSDLLRLPGGLVLTVGAAAGVQAALHRADAHPHSLVERVALVLKGRQVEI